MIFYHNISPIISSFNGISLRWYGTMFVIGLILNYILLNHLFKKEKYKIHDLESLALFLFIGMVVGARLGHVIFYNFEYFASNPIEIFKIWEGGLASHGAAIGLLITYLLWLWIYKIKFTKYVDLIAIGIPITAGFVRLGNFMNSEILGRPTDGSWGVIFQKLGETFPRHPSQLYEAGLCFLIFLILFFTYKKYYKKLPKLFILFLFTFLYFSTRFLVEFFKERHVFGPDAPLSMGQLLSILPVLISIIYFIYIAIKKKI